MAHQTQDSHTSYRSHSNARPVSLRSSAASSRKAPASRSMSRTETSHSGARGNRRRVGAAESLGDKVPDVMSAGDSHVVRLALRALADENVLRMLCLTRPKRRDWRAVCRQAAGSRLCPVKQISRAALAPVLDKTTGASALRLIYGTVPRSRQRNPWPDGTRLA